MNKKILWVVLSVIVFIGVSLFLILQEDRHQYIFVIPEGYEGKVTVTFDQPDADPFVYEDKWIVFQVPSSGHIKTSGSNVTGTMNYYFVDQAGNRTKIEDIPNAIQDLHTQSGGSQNSANQTTEIPETLSFFVGIPQEYNNDLKS